MIVDAHCHVWPDELAARLVAAHPANMDAVGDGTVAGLSRALDAAGVEMACTLSIANVAQHVRRANEFVGALDRSRFVPFGTVHTGLSVDENLAALRDNDIRGVKFHPNFQGISLADPALIDLFGALADNGIPVIAHVGHGDDAAASERGAAHHLPPLLASIPKLTFIACHFGGYHDLDAAQKSVVGERLILETSWPPALADLGAERARGIIDAHGADRVAFGSDWPMADPAREIAAIRALDLAAADEALVLGNTLTRLLGLVDSKGFL